MDTNGSQSPKSSLFPVTTSSSARNPQRPPPPSLFLGPPSRNASNVSVSSLHPTISHNSVTNPIAPARAPLLRNRSARGREPIQPITSPLGRSSQQQRQQKERQREGDRTDALWAEMQATLAEVELSATRGTHFFRPQHSAALEELRTSQIALAQAWARSEADEIIDHPGEHEAGNASRPGTSGSAGDIGVGKSLEEETEEDLLLARKRREANDRYFSRVRDGVLDVVGKLEEVAAAMGKVEKESSDIWSEGDGTGSSSNPS